MGFAQIRHKGGHLFMRHADGRTTLITVHPGEDIGKGMIRKIINDAKMTRGQLPPTKSRGHVVMETFNNCTKRA